MTKLDAVIEITEQEREAITDCTAGSLTRDEADQLERIIAEGCEQLDDSD